MPDHLLRGCPALLGLLCWAGSALAHQPVMDMAPRWEGGFGAQLRHEYRYSDDVLDGDSDASNPLGRERRVNTTWLEGVYTWRREVRATLKIPWIDQSRVSSINGVRTRQKGSGVGDIVFAVPLKKYFNFSRSTMNVGLTPNLRIPTGSTKDDYPVGDGSWDPGLGLSLSAENADFYLLAEGFYWWNTPGRRSIARGDQLGFDLNLGWHPLHDNARNLGAFVMANFEARHEEKGRDTGGTTGGTRLAVGPVLVGYWENWMLRGEITVPVYENVFGTQVSHGVLYNIGLGAAF